MTALDRLNQIDARTLADSGALWADIAAMTAALRAVLDLHVTYPDDLSRDKLCRECEDVYPCPTVRAVESALAVTE